MSLLLFIAVRIVRIVSEIFPKPLTKTLEVRSVRDELRVGSSRAGWADGVTASIQVVASAIVLRSVDRISAMPALLTVRERIEAYTSLKNSALLNLLMRWTHNDTQTLQVYGVSEHIRSATSRGRT